MKVTYSASSDIGRQRQVNQDSYGVSDKDRSEQLGQLLVVCDGMGGHAAGEVASQIGVEVILDSFYNAPHGSFEQILTQAFEKANYRIHVEGRGGMGTTGVAMLLFDNAAVVANVGDSRAYLVRGQQIRPLTRDHSYVQEQIDAHLLTPEEARTSQYRNMITRALGYRQTVSVDIFRVAVAQGDVLLLSTDGMHGLLEDNEIADIVNQMSPGAAVQRMVELANERGGHDNITVVLARIDALDDDKGVIATLDDPSSTTATLHPHDAPTQPLPVVDNPPEMDNTEQPKRSPLRSRLNRLLGLMLIVLLLGVGVGSLLLFGNGIPGATPANLLPMNAPQVLTATLKPTTTITYTPPPPITPITPPALRESPVATP